MLEYNQHSRTLESVVCDVQLNLPNTKHAQEFTLSARLLSQQAEKSCSMHVCYRTCASLSLDAYSAKSLAD